MGLSAERIQKSGKAIEHLSRQVAEPVLWKNCMDALPDRNMQARDRCAAHPTRHVAGLTVLRARTKPW